MRQAATLWTSVVYFPFSEYSIRAKKRKQPRHSHPGLKIMPKKQKQKLRFSIVLLIHVVIDETFPSRNSFKHITGKIISEVAKYFSRIYSSFLLLHCLLPKRWKSKVIIFLKFKRNFVNLFWKIVLFIRFLFLISFIPAFRTSQNEYYIAVFWGITLWTKRS